MPDGLWARVEPLLPREEPKPRGGRPAVDRRQTLNAIFYVLRTGCQWKALPRSLGSGSSAHRYFQAWCQAGVFERLWRQGLDEYDALKGIQWEWQAADGAMTKAPFGGQAVGPNPTDRAKSGTKRELLTDGGGVPLAVAVEGANRHDKKLLEATLCSVQKVGPAPGEAEQHLCLDKGFDYPDVHELVEDYGYTAHIRSRAEEQTEKRTLPGYRARRWVVERTHSWLNRFRRLLIRWEKKKENYLAMLHLACAFISFRAAGVLG
ncbi:MAG: IS5 family transposase [Candidatus Sumerlaeota bacterium]|nr:IS5 family transposase [Candidatus Sumerlaeota bacterium]